MEDTSTSIAPKPLAATNVILINLVMPVMDGCKAVHRVIIRPYLQSKEYISHKFNLQSLKLSDRSNKVSSILLNMAKLGNLNGIKKERLTEKI